MSELFQVVNASGKKSKPITRDRIESMFEDGKFGGCRVVDGDSLVDVGEWIEQGKREDFRQQQEKEEQARREEQQKILEREARQREADEEFKRSVLLLSKEAKKNRLIRAREEFDKQSAQLALYSPGPQRRQPPRYSGTESIVFLYLLLGLLGVGVGLLVALNGRLFEGSIVFGAALPVLMCGSMLMLLRDIARNTYQG